MARAAGLVRGDADAMIDVAADHRGRSLSFPGYVVVETPVSLTERQRGAYLRVPTRFALADCGTRFTMICHAGMNTADISAVARHLFETQGPKAIAEAAQNADSSEKAGNDEQAKFWRRVEAVLQEMRGPRQS